MTEMTSLPDIASVSLATLPTIPVWLVTGFLGAGKTTWLNRKLSSPAWANTAVIVNEIGAIGLDQLILGETAQDPVLVGNGCLCCAATDGLALALDGLLARRIRGEVPPFERVVIETSGLADPRAIQSWLSAEAANCSPFRPGPVITVVNASNFPQIAASYPEAAHQVAAAQMLVLSHLTQLSPEDRASLRSVLAAHSTAPIVGADEDVPPSLPAAENALSETPTAHHSHDIRVLSIEWPRPCAPALAEQVLRRVIRQAGPGVLRIKALLPQRGTTRTYDAIECVQGSWNTTTHRLDNEPTARLTVIGTGFCPDRFRDTLTGELNAALDTSGDIKPEPDKARATQQGDLD